jgi:hypothetical protein
VVQKNKFQSHKSKNKNKFEGKGKFDGNNTVDKHLIGLLAALNALISVHMETATILPMLLLVILR